eukprot:TRINITY_DN4500_c0_g1_i2.p1 TRINITY_DN4500_c0_g1~~TRINITY_DN4500_c0_g1_i2.p1  ORF type:complete len:429 (+),score=116.15 TRINITY_DN4500_c0_g1_i2:79-1287(+)
MAVAVGREFWLVAAKVGSPSEKAALYDQLRTNSALRAGAAAADGPWQLQVPDGEGKLAFGSFDNLIRLTDDLAKSDSQVDSIVHRLERQWLEIDPRAQFKVKSQRQEKTFLEYLSNWQWDETRYPKSRSISDNLVYLMSTVNKIDEEARNKTLQFNEFKTQRQNLSKKEGASLLSRDLVDLLTPEVVLCRGSAHDDWVQTEHITTVFIILPRGTEQDFLKAYESLTPNVVPRSAKKFAKLDDKDGNCIYRVIVFKSVAEDFKKACREKRWVPRDFEYSQENYEKLTRQREALDDAVKKQNATVRGLYEAAWSDTMIAWLHIKAMRIFVESVLRFGMPPRFAAFTIAPRASATPQARKALADILGKQCAGAQAYSKGEAQQEDGEEYFPYVYFSITPFTTVRT